MDFISCNNCGLVIDLDSPAFYGEHREYFNHDQDKKCLAVGCPSCKELIPNNRWEPVEDK